MALAFIVEGRMEQRAVQRLCPGTPVKAIATNGRDTSIAALAKRSAPLIRLSRRYHPIVVIFDREDRADSCDKIRSDFISALEDVEIETESLVVVVADRMSENWILGCATFRDKYGTSGAPEGSNGKAKVSAALRAKGEDYHTTTVGVDLLCSIDVNSVSENCASFAYLREALKDDCRWLQG
jgi:hypothetical protein